MNNVWILAQTKTDEAPSTIKGTPVTEEETPIMKVESDPNATTQTQQPRGLLDSPFFLIILVVMVVYSFSLILKNPQKKQRKQHKQMVQSLQKNDRVQTIGGIIGTVVDVKDDAITLKIDESNNTKIKVTIGAIGKNLSKDK